MNFLDTDKIYSCENHIDIALDDFIVKYETFPVMDSIKECKCDYCSEAAVYVISKSEAE